MTEATRLGDLNITSEVRTEVLSGMSSDAAFSAVNNSTGTSEPDVAQLAQIQKSVGNHYRLIACLVVAL